MFNIAEWASGHGVGGKGKGEVLKIKNMVMVYIIELSY